MTQTDLAHAFAALHIPGTPLALCNIWDAGSAKAVADAGAPALATGSWAVARAQGFVDGQDMPLDLVLDLLGRITKSTDLPVSLDFEGGYSIDNAELAANTARVITAGAIGVNFEDQVVGGDGLVPMTEQSARIKAMRAQADSDSIPLFINARTDVFFKGAKPETHADLLPEAIARGQAYEQAGASGLFVPGLQDPDLITQLCKQVALPVNIMAQAGGPDVASLAECGVARVSHGPGPYLEAMKTVYRQAKALLA